MMAGVRTIVEADISSKVAGLESKVVGIDKTVGDLTLFVRQENTVIRRDMAEQNAGLRHEMASQNQVVLAAIEKLTQMAQTSNTSLRNEFASDIKSLSEKQGLKSGTLIALGVLGLGVFSASVALIQRPTDNAVADMKTAIARHDREIVSREEHDREWKLRDKINDLQDKITDHIRTRTMQRLDEQDGRLRAVEQKTAK